MFLESLFYLLSYAWIGHHEVPPLVHTTMLRDFPENLRHTGDVIPTGSGSSYRPVSHPVSPMYTFKHTPKWTYENFYHICFVECKSFSTYLKKVIAYRPVNCKNPKNCIHKLVMFYQQMPPVTQGSSSPVFPYSLTSDPGTVLVVTLLLGAWIAFLLLHKRVSESDVCLNITWFQCIYINCVLNIYLKIMQQNFILTYLLSAGQKFPDFWGANGLQPSDQSECFNRTQHSTLIIIIVHQ